MVPAVRVFAAEFTIRPPAAPLPSEIPLGRFTGPLRVTVPVIGPRPEAVPMFAVIPGPFGGKTGKPPIVRDQFDGLENQGPLPPAQITV
jgi:hypothetical protein